MGVLGRPFRMRNLVSGRYPPRNPGSGRYPQARLGAGRYALASLNARGERYREPPRLISVGWSVLMGASAGPSDGTPAINDTTAGCRHSPAGPWDDYTCRGGVYLRLRYHGVEIKGPGVSVVGRGQPSRFNVPSSGRATSEAAGLGWASSEGQRARPTARAHQM